MYEGWHVEFTDHAQRRMTERCVEESAVLATVHQPDTVCPNSVHGGRLLSRYLPDWDRILVVSIEEREPEGVLLIKTVLWSKAK